MAYLTTLLAYRLEIEWLLTWFPIQSGANLDEQRTRSGVIRHRNTEAVFEAGNRETHLLGQGARGTGDPLAPGNRAVAFIEAGTDRDSLFIVHLEVTLGAAVRRKSLLIRPDTVTPFMANVDARSDDRELQGTALSLHGVITAGQRPHLLRLVASVLGP